jgi:hypothetical protein
MLTGTPGGGVRAFARFMFVMLTVLLAACGSSATPVSPTNTPRPTLPPRTPPTAMPSPVAGGDVSPGETAVVTLPGGTPVDLMYTANEAQTVTITARAMSDDGAGNALDLVLEVLDSQHNRLVYDDDGGRFVDGLAASDAAVTGLTLVPGRYTLRVNAFNGFQRGELELTIEKE